MAKSETVVSQIDDDAGLVAQARKGNRLAFEKLYRRHRDRIYGLVWRLCGGDAALAEDLLQEVAFHAPVLAEALVARDENLERPLGGHGGLGLSVLC